MHDLTSPDRDAPPIARHLVVAGRVQGVWFRRSMQDEGRALGVRGWVRNREDGTVEAWVEGPAPAVERLVDWVRGGGPPDASVTSVEVTDRSPQGHEDLEVR